MAFRKITVINIDSCTKAREGEMGCGEDSTQVCPTEPLPSSGGQQEVPPLSCSLVSIQSSRKGLRGEKIILMDSE